MDTEKQAATQAQTTSDRSEAELPKPVRRSRWDMTPEQARTVLNPNSSAHLRFNDRGATPNYREATPSHFQGETPDSKSGLNDPVRLKELRQQLEQSERNKPWTDEQLNQLLPNQGFEIVRPPQGYDPRARLRPAFQPEPAYEMPQQGKVDSGLGFLSNSGLPPVKPEDYVYFGKLLENVDQTLLPLQEQRERKVMSYLHSIKNGSPPQRKHAVRHLVFNAKELGASAIFGQVLPLMMSPTLEPFQRHTLVKVIEKVLYKLDELVKPYAKNILAVIEPMLVDEDYYVRVQGKQIIVNLSKAVGLPTLLVAIRPDIDHSDQRVRTTTARALAVIAIAQGVGSLLPFLKAVCQSKKSWTARHTGLAVIQQLAINSGCSILLHLKALVEIAQQSLKDEQRKVMSMAALAIAALAEAAFPFGIEAFESVLVPLWEGLNTLRDRSLGPYIKAVGYIIPLMEDKHASQYSRHIVPALIKLFQTPDQELINTLLRVVKQILSCKGVELALIKESLLVPFLAGFWTSRHAAERRNYRLLVETTVCLGQKVGGSVILEYIVSFLKDENEAFRKMALETVQKLADTCGFIDLSQKLQHQLMDAVIYAFHDQSLEDDAIVNCFGAVIRGLGLRAGPHFQQICGIVHFRLKNKQTKLRQQAADLIRLIAKPMAECGEQMKLGKLGSMLFENLGEEYPEVLGSILGALSAVVEEVGMSKMQPPIKDLLPKLTPILRNKNEKVQENLIELVGKIARNGALHVSPKEWMRVCFDLLELLKASKKKIRRATILSFGQIAKAIGPQDVLVTLLNNLKVQERTLRICTTVAIAIVAECCGPFTVIPALMNEYRVQDLNVQNGVLKSFAFMFEYVGEMAKDYIYSVVGLIEDALLDRDLVHRQTATATIKHLALGVQGLGCEDALIHLLNYMWPNILETSAHMHVAVMQAIDALRVSLGPGVILLYILQGLWHPARRIRTVYWRIFNMLYYNSQEALTPYYPEIPSWKQPYQATFL